MSADIRPGPGEMSASEAWEYAHDIERDSSKDERRITTWLIDLEGPRGQGADDEREARRRREVKLAQERVGRSDEDRMRWLLRFRSRDLADLSARDWLDLLFEILAFAAPPLARFVPCEIYLVEGEIKLDLLELRNLHAWVHSGLRGLRESPYVVEDENGVASDAPREWLVDGNVEHRFTWVNDRLVDQPSGDSGSVHNRFKAQVAGVVSRQADRIRLCQDRNCAKLFLAHKRQTYCNAKCSQKNRTRKYRARYPERISDQRHNAYVREKRQDAPNVKVARHPRKKAKP